MQIGGKLKSPENKGADVVAKSNDFEIVTEKYKSDETQLPSGHATKVRKIETLSGTYVEKELNETGRFSVKPEDRKNWWDNSQKKSKQNSDAVRAKQNVAYVVPKTHISHGKVREEFASGVRWRDAIGDLSPADKVWAYKALAEFVNDMSELRPVMAVERPQLYCLPVRESETLAKILAGWDEKYVSADDKKLIQDIYDYMMHVPENTQLVYGHNDLHGDNIIIDLEKRQIAIIDFECAGSQPMMDTMYFGTLGGNKEFWDYVNGLPRTTNPKLKWNYVPEHRELLSFLRWGTFSVQLEGVEKMSKKIANECKRIRPIFAAAKLKQKLSQEKSDCALVPMSHYEQEF